MEAKLLDRLRKILALTESPVEGEAQAAAGKLRELLIEHNLTVADLEMRGSAAPRIHEEGHDLGKAAFNWKLDLAETIAEYYYCAALVSRYRKTVKFVGRPDNVESLKMLYAWLIDQIKEISASERRNHHVRTGEHIDPLRWQVNFGRGLVDRLGSRLAEMRERDRVDSKICAIVVHHATEVSDYLESIGESRIDGRKTKYELEREEYWKKRNAEDAELKRTNIEAYYEKYPWERPETDAERIAREKKEARNAARRTGRQRAYYQSAEEQRKENEAYQARQSGRDAVNKVNLQPFLRKGTEEVGE